MANEFYKGPSRQEKIGSNISAQRGPDMREAIEGNNRRTQSIVEGLNSLVNLGKKGVDIYAEKKTKEAIASGKTKAAKGEARPEDASFWSGDAEQEAYDDVRAEGAVAGLPSFVEQHMASNKDIKKPLDEMTRDERAGWVAKAREAYFKENKLDDSPYKDKADAYANLLSNKQLDMMDQQVVKLRGAKAQAGVSNLVAKTVTAFGGDPAEIDATLDTDMQRYQQSLGDPEGTKTKAAIMTGLLQSVMSEQPNLKTLSYLKSEEAQKRFGHLEGFDKAVSQANNFSLKAQNAQRVKLKAGAENEFYGLLNVDGFSSKEEVQAQLNKYSDEVLDQGDKFSLMNKALRHMKISGKADELQQAIAQKNFGVVNAAKQEELLASFERNVMSKSTDIDAVLNAEGGPNDPETDTQNSFTKWVLDGYNVPSHVKNHFNSPLNAGNTSAWDNRLVTYQKMSQRLGSTGLGKLYESETQASLDEYAALSADVNMKPEDRKQAIINFMEGAKQDRVTGISTNANIRREIMDSDTGIMKELQKFAAEGGGDTTFDFSVPADLQPFTTTRDNADSSPTGYAVKSLAGNYSIYRRQNPNEQPEVALRKAKNDFLSQNNWVDWDGKSTYVPREFGDNFAERGMNYVAESGVLSKLSISEGLPVEAIKRKITIEPSSDYHTSRKLSVFYDGIEQDESFNLQQFDKRIGLLDAQTRTRIERENSDLRNTPEYKARQEKLKRFQNSLGTFGVFPN